MSFSTRTTYQGKAVNQGTLAILTAANILLSQPEFGGEKEPLTLIQGGYNKGGVKASAGTHDGGGAIDITTFNYKNRIKVFRLLGVAIWHRYTIPGLWSAHLHGIVCGDGSASSGAKAQVKEYYNKQDGLAGSGADKDWRPYKVPILFRFGGSKAVHYVTKATTGNEQPYSKSKHLKSLPVGTKFTPVAWVKNAYGNYWAVNKQGLFVFGDNLSKTKPATQPAYKVTKSSKVYTVTAKPALLGLA
jgi:hypothetical protein